MKKLSCAFTGHKPSRFKFGYDEDHPDFESLKMKLITQIVNLCYEGVKTFYTRMSLGVDIWCAEIVLALQKDFNDLKLICVIPYAGQEKKWSSEYQARYRHLLENCSSMVTISKEYTDTCYLDCNRYVIDHTDILLAVYAEDDRTEEGADQAVHYAQSKGKRIIFIHPDTYVLTEVEGK